MIIAISGKKYHGKDTAAEALVDRHKFVRIGLADKLKDITSKVLKIHRPDMDDPTIKEKLFSKPIRITSTHVHDLFEILEDDGFVVTEDNYRAVCHEFVHKPLVSIRDALQVVGTDICRAYVTDSIWLDYFKKQYILTDKNVVVSDARYANERKFMKQLGGILILIKRSGLESTDTHISENQLGNDSEYDIIIKNDSSITHLHSSISMWWTIRRDLL